MREHLRQLGAGYLLAVAATAAVGAVRFALTDLLGDVAPFLPFVLSVTVAAWYGGWKPGLLATALGGVAGVYLFTPPHLTLRIERDGELAGLLVFLLIGVTVSWLCEALHAATRRADQRREALRVTLASIGDAVITTDTGGRVASMNPVAEALTGWTQGGAAGRPLEEVFRIVNERTRQTVENPVQRVLAEGRVVGLANHTVLIARDGTERPIDDSAAPIRDAGGRVLGVVLIFRDITARKQAAEALRQSEARNAAVVNAALDGIITIDH